MLFLFANCLRVGARLGNDANEQILPNVADPEFGVNSLRPRSRVVLTVWTTDDGN
jgi:hypothetical protein